MRKIGLSSRKSNFRSRILLLANGDGSVQHGNNETSHITPMEHRRFVSEDKAQRAAPVPGLSFRRETDAPGWPATAVLFDNQASRPWMACLSFIRRTGAPAAGTWCMRFA
jgi:hypothetical protein